MAEGEAAHSRMKEGYRQETLEKLQINTEGAKITTQQGQQQAQQEAQQYFGNVVNYADQEHLNKIREEKTKTAQAKKDAADANKRAKASEKPEHNTDHKNERTPNNRAKPKQRAGASLKKLEPVPPSPTGETAPGSQDKPKYDNPESEHEPKGKAGRPTNAQGAPPVRKYIFKEPPTPTPKATAKAQQKANQRSNPRPTQKHDTDINNNNNNNNDF